MALARPVPLKFCLRLAVLIVAVVASAYLIAVVTHAQSEAGERPPQPDVQRALTTRADAARDPAAKARVGGYVPHRLRQTLPLRPAAPGAGAGARDASSASRRVARPARLHGPSSAQQLSPASKFSVAAESSTPQNLSASTPNAPTVVPALITRRIPSGTSLSYVLHTSQLSTISSAGSNEQFYDSDVDLVADTRTTFDTAGGAFDIAASRTGARYAVFTAIDDRGTQTESDDVPTGVLVVGRDANNDFVRDSFAAYDLRRDFGLPSAAAIVSGTSRAGREFVVVSSSGYFNAADTHDPANEPTAGVALLVRDSSALGFDAARSRTLVRAGSGELNNANALALLPNNDLLIADFDSDELRVVRDTDADGIPDRLDPVPYYSFRFSDDAPVEVTANSRGVVFTHSVGNSVVMLAIYDTNADGRADTDEVCIEGLSIDNNLILHGLTTDREGTIYVIEDAAGASDLVSDGGDGGTPLIDAFPDPALNGFPRDGTLYAAADNPTSQALSGLAFGEDATLAPVARLALTNSASLQGAATRDGLATITGAGLTFGRTGASAADAAAKGVRVYVEGQSVPVLSFNDSRVNIHVTDAVGTGVRSVVIAVDGYVTAAEDVSIVGANPGLFTVGGMGTGEAIALLVSGMRYTRSPFPATFGGGPSVVALFGTGWRNSVPVAVQIGGRAALVESSVATGFPGLDQLNVRLPDGVTGAAAVVVTAANGAQSRSGVTITVN